jgi:AcrR family transcriptional regulator
VENPATSLAPAAVEVRRQRVEHVALRLFSERGYRAVTIDQIAEAAGVSRRTFFRYFPEKYDVLLADTRRRQAIICAHMEQNDREPSTFEALCQAILFSCDFDEDARANARMRFQLSETNTDVFGRMVADTEVLSERLRRIVAARLQTDEHADMRADLVVRIVTAAAQTALRTWYSRDCKTELADHLRAAFALLGGRLLDEVAELDAAASLRSRQHAASLPTPRTTPMG